MPIPLANTAVAVVGAPARTSWPIASRKPRTSRTGARIGRSTHDRPIGSIRSVNGCGTHEILTAMSASRVVLLLLALAGCNQVFDLHETTVVDDDRDDDGLLDVIDNCPDVKNPRQEDMDGDHIGDICDA